MSILKVANVHFNSTGTNRIDYLGDDKVRITSANGTVIVGTSTPLQVVGSINATDFNSTSDIKLKENINTITNGMQIVSSINPVSFNWIENGKKSYGVVAQEIETVLPEIVNDTDTKHVSYIQLIAILIAAVKELKEDLEKLKTKA